MQGDETPGACKGCRTRFRLKALQVGAVENREMKDVGARTLNSDQKHARQKDSSKCICDRATRSFRRVQ